MNTTKTATLFASILNDDTTDAGTMRFEAKKAHAQEWVDEANGAAFLARATVVAEFDGKEMMDVFEVVSFERIS